LTESVDIAFAADHPTAAGHFPGNPILPGALLLDTVVQAITGGAGAPHVTIQSAKFLRPVRPGDRLHIAWERKGEQTHFSCTLAASGEIAISGVLRLGDTPA
jgi:3-hydroxyacyl-[acyl-carrier-protein] dehydratase